MSRAHPRVIGSGESGFRTLRGSPGRKAVVLPFGVAPMDVTDCLAEVSHSVRCMRGQVEARARLTVRQCWQS